jgi:hypothetical protein
MENQVYSTLVKFMAFCALITKIIAYKLRSSKSWKFLTPAMIIRNCDEILQISYGKAEKYFLVLIKIPW